MMPSTQTFIESFLHVFYHPASKYLRRLCLGHLALADRRASETHSRLQEVDEIGDEGDDDEEDEDDEEDDDVALHCCG